MRTCCDHRSVLMLLTILSFQSFVIAHLSLTTTQCGSLTCKEHSYCSQYDKQCKLCEDICDQNKHNTDSQICERDCQDYLHDARYGRISQTREDDSTSSKDSQKITLVISCIAIVFAIAIGLIFYLFKKKKLNIESFRALYTKKPPEDVENKTPNNGVNTISLKPDLRLDIPSPGVDSDVSPTMTTAEDQAYVYDNHAMSPASTQNNMKMNRDATYSLIPN